MIKKLLKKGSMLFALTLFLSLSPSMYAQYCIPQGTNSARYVNNFSTTGGTQNVTNLNSGFSTGGYGNFYDTQTIAREPGQSFSFTADIIGGTAGFRVWVDWNQNGVFETSEVAYQSSGYANSQSGTITVPATAEIGETRMRIVSHWLSSTGDVSPCATAFTYGEFEDYKVITGVLDVCTGAVAGTIVGDPTREVCANTAFSISVTGNSDPATGLIRTWQSSPAGAGTWTDLGSGAATLNVAGITAPTDYRYHVACDNGDSDTSSVVSVTLNPNPSECYCTPSSTNSSYFIKDFSTTGGVQNISNLNSGYSTGGYGDFTAMTVEANPGDEISFVANLATGNTYGFRIWVDWNQDGAFDVTEEVAYASTGYLTNHTGAFTIPVDVMGGTTRMRIVNHYLNSTGLINPCITGFTYGEFEDYTFEIIPLDTCTGAEAGTIVGDPTREECALSPFTLSVTGNSEPATGLTRTWQSSPAGAGTWTDLDVSSSTITIPGIDTPTDFRYHVECDNGDSDDSAIIAVTLNPNPSECYCTPEGINPARYINNFSTTGGIDNISNLASGFSPGGYGNFVDTFTVSQSPSESVDFAVDIVGGTAGFRIWVDWNQDGAFDVVEEVAFNTTTFSANHTGSFEVPADALEGETRMRIVSNWSLSNGGLDPCVTGYNNGEFEDYTFDVIFPDSCSGVPVAGTAIADPTSGNAGTTYTVSAEGYTAATGLSFQWQSNTNGAGWIDEGTATTFNTPFTAIAPPELGDVVQWRLALTCIASAETAYSTTIATFTTTLTYCTATSGNIEAITRVVFVDIDNASSAASTDSYEDFTAMIAHVEAGETYSFAAEGNTDGSYTNYFTVWVDWNHNGEFEASEMTEIGSIFNSDGTDGQQAINDIVVPADAAAGDTRMRVRKNFNSSLTTPCGSNSFGQTEDYTVNVAGGGGDPGLDCAQGDDSNGFENGLNITGGGIFRNADDFMVSPDNTLELLSIELNILSMAPITTLDLNFYNDDSGSPGATVVESVTGLVPYAQVPVGSAFGYTVYTVLVEVDLSFPGGTTGTSYWMEPVAQGGTSYWEVSSVGTLGEPIHSSESGGPWIEDADGNQAVFKLHCDVAIAPPVECLFDITFGVEPITRLAMANVDNVSSASSTEVLEDFTSVVVLAEPGATVDVALEGFTDGPYTNYFTIFVNTGGSGDEWSSYETFEIGSITGSTGTDGQQATSTITLPASLIDGTYLMRVVKNYSVSPTSPCGSYGYGQAEDYTLEIGTLGDCSGTPDGGEATVNPAVGNPGSTYMVSATGYSFGNGLTYQWQSNTDGAGWVNEGASSTTYSSYTATAPTQDGTVVEWRLEVTCTLSTEVSYSTTATFTTGMVYCAPELDCSDGDVINNVTFQEIDNTTDCSPNGYGDFTTMVATVQSGGTYSMSVSVGAGFTYESVSVWIDYDNNGTFDEDEFLLLGTGSGSVVTGDVAIPVGTTDGNYRMRVRVAAVDAPLATPELACDEDQFYGETEDYTVTVDGVAGIGDYSNLNFSYHPNPMNDVLYIKANQKIETVSGYNVLGQQVLNNNQFADGKVDVSSLPTGTFIFRVTFEGGFEKNFKVIKE